MVRPFYFWLVLACFVPFTDLQAAYRPGPADLKVSEIRGGESMRLQIAKETRLAYPASVAVNSAFPPAANIIYFTNGKAYQRKPDAGPFAMIDLDTGAVDPNLGAGLLSFGRQSVERCELELITALGVTTLSAGFVYGMLAYGVDYYFASSLTIPLQDANIAGPGRAIGQFRCHFSEQVTSNRTPTLADLRAITGERLDVLVQQ